MMYCPRRSNHESRIEASSLCDWCHGNCAVRTWTGTCRHHGGHDNREGLENQQWGHRIGLEFHERPHLQHPPGGYPDEFIDVTNASGGQPKGLYMDNTGLGSGATTANYFQDGDRYVDWWFTTASNSGNAFTYSQHFVLVGNDQGVHVYFVVNH